MQELDDIPVPRAGAAQALDTSPSPEKGFGSGNGAQRGAVNLWLVCFVAAAVVFSVAPGIDIAVSSLFYKDGAFAGAVSPLAETVRQAIWNVAIAVALFAVAGALIAYLRGGFLRLTYPVWTVVVAIYVLGPGVMANLVLKANWGRARPATIEAFGGTADFTPALLPTDQCARNCSFVSGEVSGAAALAIAIWLLSGPVATPWLRAALRATAVATVALTALLRVAAGRHFLSDTAFAVLIVTGIALLLLRYRGRNTTEADNAAD